MYLSTKKLGDYNSSIKDGISDNTNNVFNNTTIPDTSGKQIVRAQNLRRTQDMICQDYYSPSSTYSVGDVVIYENKLYECSTDISVAEAWDSTHWTQINFVDYAKYRTPDIGYFEITSYTGTLTDEQWAELHKSICFVRVITTSSDTRNGIYVYNPLSSAGSTSNRIYLQQMLYIGANTMQFEIRSGYIAVTIATKAYEVSGQDYITYNKSYIDYLLSNKLETTKLAAKYSTNNTYAVGDVVIYQNDLYECNTTISTAEAWTAAHWTKTSLSTLIEKYKLRVIELASDAGDTFSADLLAKIKENPVIFVLHNPDGRYFRLEYQDTDLLYYSV